MPYFVVDPQTLDEIEESILTIAKLIDARAEGDALVAQLAADRAALEAKVASIPAEERPKVFVLLDTSALYTVGSGTFLSEMITTAGADNVVADFDNGYFQISEETLFEIDPEIIICTYPMRDEVLAREAWQDLAAVKNERVYDVDSNAVSRPDRVMYRVWSCCMRSLQITMKRNQKFLLYTILLAVLVVSVIMATAIGAVAIPPQETFQIIISRLTGLWQNSEIPSTTKAIIWNLRLPRVLLGVLVGASLALAGVSFQGLLRNPLADPFTIGVSSGAAEVPR